MKWFRASRRVVTQLALACLFSGAAALSCAAIIGTTSYHYTRTPSNKINTRFQDGVDGTVATPLTWATFTPISVLTTDTGSINVCQNYLTQPASPGNVADITVSTGFTLPTGFSLGSAHNCVLSWATPSAATTSVSLTASLSGVTDAVSPAFSITITAPPVSDTTAPTVPTGVVAVNGTGSVALSWDASSDPYDGGTASGVASYDISLNGGAPVNVPASPGLSPQLTCTNVGTLSPTPTCVQSGSQWTLVSAGTADGTADAHGVLNAQVSGDVCVTAKVNSITNTADYAQNGAWFSNSLNANSAKFTCTVSKLASGVYFLNSSRRTTDGGSRGSVATVNPSPGFPAWLRACDVASVFSCDYSLDGNTWVPLSTSTSIAAIGSTPYVGLYDTATTGGGGATQTGVVQQININNVGRLSYTYVTATSGTVAIRAKDVAGNNSAYGASVAVAPTTPADVTAPAAPTSVSCTSGGQTSINCTGTPPTDASGIRGYIWSFAPTSGGTYVDQTEQALIAFTLSGLSASTQRCGRVKAIDNAGNVGVFSSNSCATTDSSGTDPTNAPTISSFIQNADRSASYTLVHTIPANTHHFNVQMADCADGQTPGSYSTVGTYQHTTASTTLTGFDLFDAPVKSVKVQAANAANTVIFSSAATSCVTIFDPWSQAFQLTSGHYVEEYGIEDRATVERSLATGYFNLGAEWAGIMRVQLQLGAFEGPLTGNATSHAQANPVTGAGYERGAELMNWYSSSATAKGKKFIMMLSDRVNGNYPTISPSIYPLWASDEAAYDNPSDPLGNGCYFKTETGSQGSSGWSIYWRNWDPRCAAAYADAVEWICRHYDGDPAFEGLQLASVSTPVFETNASFPHSGFTWAGHIAGVKTILARARQHCVHKEVSIRFDWPPGYPDALSFWRWARSYRIAKSDYDFSDFGGRTGSVNPGSVASGENFGYAAFRGAASPNAAASGVSGVNLLGKSSLIGAVESFDWVRAGTYGVVSIDEFLDIAKYYKSSRVFWTPDDFSCGRDSGFTPTNLGKTSSTGTNCPGSGTTIWTIIKQCMAATTDQAAIGCTIAIRNAALTATCPTDWIGCTP